MHMDCCLVRFDRFIISFIIRLLIIEERIHLCLNKCFHLKKLVKYTHTRHQFQFQPIYLTNFYKYSYLKISIRLFNLFLDDFLDVSKYSFLKSFKNYLILINFYNKFLENKNDYIFPVTLIDWSCLLL